jgi:nucleoside-diphosphate-sugar epimerase
MEDSGRLLNQSADQEFLATDEYSLAKARQEDLLNTSGKNNWTIIRPYITYDTYRLQLGVLEKEEWLYRALRGRTVVFSHDIAGKLTTLTAGYDVARAIGALVGNQQALGRAFNITTAESIKWEDVLATYMQVLTKYLGTQPKVLLQDMPAFFRSKPATYQIKYDRLYDRRFDCSRISGLVETQHFINTRSGLQSSLEAFLRDPKFAEINWKSEAIRDKQTGEWTSLGEIAGIKQKLKYLVYRTL